MKNVKLLLVLLVGCMVLSACGKGASEGESLDKNGDGYITGDEVDLRATAVQYMLDMANIQWTAGPAIDYTADGFSKLVYEPGKTYLGMVYNNNRNGLENFELALDEAGTYILEDTGWNTAPGNSCATSIEHAWQLVSPSVEYDHSMDMMPCHEYTNVTAVGDVDWSSYDGNVGTETVVSSNEKAVIMEAYSQMEVGDSVVRWTNGSGGHALMLTKEAEVVRDSKGNVMPAKSSLYLTEQNSTLNDSREYPSSWKVDRQVTFTQAYMDGYLPVSTIELQEGKTPVPTFDVENPVTEETVLEDWAGIVKSNYCFVTVKAEVREKNAKGDVVASAAVHPYTREFSLQELREKMDMEGLAEGKYYLTIQAEVGLGSECITELKFTK